jgi:hypothetical protein
VLVISDQVKLTYIREEEAIMEERRRQQTLHARRLAATVAIPGWAAQHFSLGMLAVLGAIRDEADDQGRCTATVAEITNLAGVSRSTTQAAIKTAHSIGAIAIEDTTAGDRVIVNRCIRTHREATGAGDFAC